MRSSQGFWGTGEQGQFFSGEQRPKNKGNRGTQAILGTGNIEKQDFVFGKKGHFFEGNKGTGTPPPPTGRASIIYFAKYVQVTKCFILWNMETISDRDIISPARFTLETNECRKCQEQTVWVWNFQLFYQCLIGQHQWHKTRHWSMCL